MKNKQKEWHAATKPNQTFKFSELFPLYKVFYFSSSFTKVKEYIPLEKSHFYKNKFFLQKMCQFSKKAEKMAAPKYMLPCGGRGARPSLGGPL